MYATLVKSEGQPQQWAARRSHPLVILGLACPESPPLTYLVSLPHSVQVSSPSLWWAFWDFRSGTLCPGPERGGCACVSASASAPAPATPAVTIPHPAPSLLLPLSAPALTISSHPVLYDTTKCLSAIENNSKKISRVFDLNLIRSIKTNNRSPGLWSSPSLSFHTVTRYIAFIDKL